MGDLAIAVVDTVAALDGAGSGVSVVHERGCRLAASGAAGDDAHAGRLECRLVRGTS